MSDKTEIALIPAIAERLGANEIRIGQRPIVDDVSMAAHRPQLQQSAPSEDRGIDTLIALKVKFVLFFGDRHLNF